MSAQACLICRGKGWTERAGHACPCAACSAKPERPRLVAPSRAQERTVDLFAASQPRTP